MQRLTDLAVQQLPLPDKGQKTYFEGEGFGVRVSQGGSKTFVVMFGADRRLKSLGRYPDTSLKDARRAAKAIQAAPPAKKRSVRYSEAVTAFIDDCRSRIRLSTVERYQYALKPIEADYLADIPVNLTDPNQVKALKVFLNWCVENDLIDQNPYRNRTVRFNQRDRVLTVDEIRQIWYYERPPFTDHLKLLLLTGQRRSQFNHYEIRDDTIWFPASQMKGGRDHIIPLLPMARQYAENLQRCPSWNKPKARLDRHVPIPHWTIHDIRRTFATIHAQIGTPIHVIEAMLAHRNGTISGIAAIYIRHQFLEEARTALEQYENRIQTLIA